MKPINTEVLNDKLLKSNNFKEFKMSNEKHLRKDSFHHYLYDLISASGMKNSEVFTLSCMSESYGYQILNGSRQPSRDKVLLLALCLSLDLEKTNQLLKLAEKSELYVRNKRDAIIMFSLVNKVNLIDTNILLEEEKYEILE